MAHNDLFVSLVVFSVFNVFIDPLIIHRTLINELELHVLCPPHMLLLHLQQGTNQRVGARGEGVLPAGVEEVGEFEEKVQGNQ